MKTLIRASVVALVFAGAVASAFTPKVQNHAVLAASHNNLAISSAVPIPSCNPHDGCI